MEHSRLHMGRVNPVVGDTFVTNHRRPILTLTEDTSGGVHDTLLAACDRYRYDLLGARRTARQLHGQPARRAGSELLGPVHAEPAEPVRERPPGAGRDDRDRPAGLDPGQPRHPARRARSHRSCSPPARRTWRPPTAPARPTRTTGDRRSTLNDRSARAPPVVRVGRRDGLQPVTASTWSSRQPPRSSLNVQRGLAVLVAVQRAERVDPPEVADQRALGAVPALAALGAQAPLVSWANVSTVAVLELAARAC